jgi:putative ATP-dependent endonuclease of OLD family
MGPSNGGKSSVLEALDLLLHHGMGRPRVVSELDFYARDPEAGFEIEAALAELPGDLVADAVDHLEGWHAGDQAVVPEPDGEDVEPVLRVRVTGTRDLELNYTFAKPESNGARFSPRLRRRIGWVFDGRGRDPAREFAFYQGSVLDRLFDGVELDEAIAALRTAMASGAQQVNDAPEVEAVLHDLGVDLQGLGLLGEEERPDFEAGALSRRELLQALRLGMPSSGGIAVPVVRQGRGAQRLLLVAALLRLARVRHEALIAAFDEPEQALEPLRQTQLVDMLRSVVDDGGQLFLATHSPEIVRGFTVDDLVLMPEDGALRQLASLPGGVKRHYERQLDGAVVRALFAPVPLLVEGPSDRPVLQTFWRALVNTRGIPPMAHLGLEVINSEGADQQRPMAALLYQAGKPVIVWAERDVPDKFSRLFEEGNWSALLLHDPNPGYQNLEQSLAMGTTMNALVAALQAVAHDRGVDWQGQRDDLIGRISSLDAAHRGAAQAATDLAGFLGALDELDARRVVASALAPKKGSSSPFDMKGARQGRLVAEAIVAVAGVPPPYAAALCDLAAWFRAGCHPERAEFSMAEVRS